MRDALPFTFKNIARVCCLAIIALAFVVGCSSAPAVSSDGRTPPFTLKLRAHTHDHRFTYFEINKKGDMRFGGGRDASVFEARPDIMLTPEQRNAVWRIITEQHVTESENSTFADFKSVEYDVDIWPGAGFGRSFRTIDDKSPGVKSLHDLLFKYHLDAGMKLPGLPAENK